MLSSFLRGYDKPVTMSNVQSGFRKMALWPFKIYNSHGGSVRKSPLSGDLVSIEKVQRLTDCFKPDFKRKRFFDMNVH